MPSEKPVKAFISRLSSLMPERLPSPPRLPTEARETLREFKRLGTEKKKVTIEPRDRKQTYLLIQSIQRTNPASAQRLKSEIAKEIQTEAAKGEHPVYLTFSAAHDIVEHEYQRAIGKCVTTNLQYARARFREANEILHPVMSKGFRIGIEEE